MAITTLKGHVSRAIDFYKKDSIYFLLGRSTAWDDEETPPVPQPTDEITEKLAYKVVDSKFLVIPSDKESDITYNGSYWTIVPQKDAYTKGAKWVYISSEINFNDFKDVSQYRQLGVCTNVVKKTDVASGKSNLLPSELSDTGILEILDNRKVINRQLDQSEKISVIIEF